MSKRKNYLNNSRFLNDTMTAIDNVKVRIDLDDICCATCDYCEVDKEDNRYCNCSKGHWDCQYKVKGLFYRLLPLHPLSIACKTCGEYKTE